MDQAAPITLWLGGTIVTVFAAGAGGAWWFGRILSAAKDEMLDAIRESRAEGSREIARVADRVDLDVKAITGRVTELGDAFHRHELHVEQKFVSKDTANLVFGRIEATVVDLGKGIDVKLVRIDERIERLSERIEREGARPLQRGGQP